MKKPSICIDAGHGGRDPGALGPTGLRESEVALSVALLLGARLEAAGWDVTYTRKDDRFLELHERAAIANKAGVDLFLSIHCNSAANPASGFEVFTTPGFTGSDPFATELFLGYAEGFPEKRKRMDDRDGDPDKEASLAVLRLTSMPAALFELEFIHTPEGEAFLRDKRNHVRMATALAAATASYLRAGSIVGTLETTGWAVLPPHSEMSVMPAPSEILFAAQATTEAMLKDTRDLIHKLTAFADVTAERANAFKQDIATLKGDSTA